MTELDRRAPIARSSETADGGSAVYPSSVGSGQVGILEAIRRRWLSALIPLVLLLAAAVAVGLLRPPVYTAGSRLIVQAATGNPASLPGAVTATEGLAETYSRALASDEIVTAVAQETGVEEDDVRDQVSATPVPDSAIIEVRATGPTEAEAVALANSAAGALTAYVDGLGGDSPEAAGLLREYRKAAARYEEELDEKVRLEQEQGNSDSAAAEAASRQASVDADAAQVQRDALGAAYQNGQRFFTAPVATLARATEASSDFSPKLQLFLLIGAVAGLATGAAVATLRAGSALSPSRPPGFASR